MKRIEILLLLSLMALLYSCNQEYAIPASDPGQSVDLSSRALIDDESLKEGSTALFNASGGLQINNQIFTYRNGKWGNDQLFFWDEEPGDTYVTALYPAYEGGVYSTETLYSADGLDDILIARDTLSAKQGIELQFGHLFSKLTVHVKTGLHERMKELQLTTPVIIHSLSVADGKTVLLDKEEGKEHTTIRTKNETAVYSFILPPADHCSLNLKLLMEDGSENAFVLPAHHFESGYDYRCSLVDEGIQPGIRTVADLKDFCSLINNNTCSSNKTLSDFGSLEQGKMVYRLLSDLVLTAEDSWELLPIGYGSDASFAAVFDGMNHTISNLEVQEHELVAGLFGRIHQDGIIKNLHLDGCTASADIVDASVGFGFLAGLCYGTIDGCSVSNASAVMEDNNPTGGLVGSLRSGTVVNSSVSNVNLTSKGYLGGLVGISYDSAILNSYSASNFLYRRATHCGGFAGFSRNGFLRNCYLYNLSLKVTSMCGLLIGKTETVTIESVFYDADFTFISESTGDVWEKNNKSYTRKDFATRDEGILIYKLLNDWISTEAEELYPGKSFQSWDSHATLPAVFK